MSEDLMFSAELDIELRRARQEAITYVMGGLALRAGARLAPLRWSLTEDGVVGGYVYGATQENTARTLAEWARFLGLTRSERSGTVAYSGVVDGHSVHLWGLPEGDGDG